MPSTIFATISAGFPAAFGSCATCETKMSLSRSCASRNSLSYRSSGASSAYAYLRLNLDAYLWSDVYIVGWTEGYITQQILEQAVANGDAAKATEYNNAAEAFVTCRMSEPSRFITKISSDVGCQRPSFSSRE